MNVKEDSFFPSSSFLFCFLSHPSGPFPPPPRLKMQFVKTALSSVWTRERRGGPLYVNTEGGKKALPIFAIN